MAPLVLLGTHHPGWLSRAAVPLFVSDTRLRGYKTLPTAIAPWACDSGGFTQLQKHGDWTVPPAEYVARLRRYRDEIGHLAWAAPQDWMCEQAIIYGGRWGGLHFVGTRRTIDPDGVLTDTQLVAEHQRRTVLNGAQLREMAPDLPIILVVQGDTPDAYVACVDLYLDLAGIDLTREPLVGVGSVCRIQDTARAGRILAALHTRGVRRLHGFGFKLKGLERHGHRLTTADTLAWSYAARRLQRPALPGCVGKHKNCANCLPYALHWRQKALAAAHPAQLPLWTDQEAA